MIQELFSDNTDVLNEALNVIRQSFKTVADQFGFTEENAPTNAAFMTFERLHQSLSSGTRIFALYDKTVMAGTIALERSRDNDEVYYIERLAVLPVFRYRGFGKSMMDYAFHEVKKLGGKKISIGIINENAILKRWYLSYGFVETSVKTFDHLPFSVCFMEMAVR
jgi:diamine N-acetyltransferase